MDVRLPRLGEGADSGTVASIFVKEGDQVKKDQPVIELESEKAVASIPSPAAGTVTKMHVKEGDSIRVGIISQKDFMLSHGYIENDFDVFEWAEPKFLEQAAKELLEEEGRADVAGFHVSLDEHSTADRAPFLRWLRARRDKLIRFVDREQGLILARGNPAHVRNLRDVAERHLRFVNRQPGSGTRLLIDRMLAAERIEPAALEGFGNEEFTHPAVAATVASGGADAGFGLRAAAAEYGLAFVPLVRERYFLAVRAKDAVKPPILRLLDALRSPAFARRVRRLPGYDCAAAGSVSGLEALAPVLPRPRARPPSATRRPGRSRAPDTAA